MQAQRDGAATDERQGKPSCVTAHGETQGTGAQPKPSQRIPLERHFGPAHTEDLSQYPAQQSSLVRAPPSIGAGPGHTCDTEDMQFVSRNGG